MDLSSTTSTPGSGGLSSQTLPRMCAPTGLLWRDRGGFGAHWIEWSPSTLPLLHGHYLFQNIDTGQVRSLPGWRPGGRIIPDLDSESLARTLCPPLTVPAGVPPPLGGPPPGALSLYGSFAIASPGAGGDVLERCGSTLKLAVGSHDGPLGASSHAIVWANSPTSRRLHGLFLPSLRRFVIATNPAAATSPYPGAYRVVLSSGELYVFDESGRVFATRAPTQRHRLVRTRRHHSRSADERCVLALRSRRSRLRTGRCSLSLPLASAAATVAEH